jgi:ribosomal protein S6--L-glutamate ligase
MKIVILSRGPDLYSTRRIREACQRRGHAVRVLNPLNFSLHLEEGRPNLLYKSIPLEPADAVIPRIVASRDKLRSCQTLIRHRIGMPKTVVVRRPDGVLPAIERMGGPPIIIKLLEGTHGTGVILADSTSVAQAIVETLQGPGGKNVLLQEFITESRGRDIRAFVIGRRVVAAMRRSARGDEYRSNVHRGGRVERVDLEPEYARTAVQAAQILGLRVAGVDMLEGREGPLVTEVNASPGLEGIEHATGVDVADAIVEHVEEEELFADVDIRQRLTLKHGYGILEFNVEEGSELAYKTLGELRLRDREVVVLSVMRGDQTLPNPKGERRLLPGDRLFCFGSTGTLKVLAARSNGKKPSSHAPASVSDSERSVTEEPSNPSATHIDEKPRRRSGARAGT